VGIVLLVALSMMLSVTPAGLSTGPRNFESAALHSSVTEYPVTFTETGLPSGTSWSVTLNGTPQTSSDPSMVFEEPNGSYVYYVGAINGYTVGPEGNVTVQNGPVSETIEFVSTTPVPGSCGSFRWSGTNDTIYGNCLGFFQVDYRAYNATTGWTTDNSTFSVGPLAEVAPSGTVVALGPLGYQGSGTVTVVSTLQEVNVTDAIVGNVTNAVGVNGSTGDPNGQTPQWTPSDAPGAGGSTTWGAGNQILGSVAVGLVFHFENGSGGSSNRVKFDVTVSGWPWVNSQDTLGLGFEAQAYALPVGSHFSYTASNDTIVQQSDANDATISSLAFGPSANATGTPSSSLQVTDEVGLFPIGADPTMAVALLTFVGTGGYSQLVYDPWILFGPQTSTAIVPPAILPATASPSLPLVAVGAIVAAGGALGLLAYRLRRRPAEEGLVSAAGVE